MSIIQNKKAFHDYFVEDRYEAGIVLQGWEVKAIRAGRANLKEAYVTIKDGELYLFGSHISPLTAASTSSRNRYVPANCCCTQRKSANSSARCNAPATR